jgi:hypothetical protein
MAPASFPIVSNPVRATGGFYHRVTASYGTVPQPAQGSPTQMRIPPGPTPRHSYHTPIFAPTWSIVRPSLPRNAPWAGNIPHGIPDVTYTPAVGQPVQGETPATRTTFRPRGPIAQGRITRQPRPMFSWKVQGGGT